MVVRKWQAVMSRDLNATFDTGVCATLSVSGSRKISVIDETLASTMISLTAENSGICATASFAIAVPATGDVKVLRTGHDLTSDWRMLPKPLDRW